MIKEDEPQLTHRDEEEHSQLVNENARGGMLDDQKLKYGETLVEEAKVPTVHVDKNYTELVQGDGYDREKELKELKKKARQEEQKEVEELMSKAQPAVPQGWDYLILPRKINLLRVKPPPTIMQDDYFKPVKALALPLRARGIVFAVSLAIMSLALSILGVMVFNWAESTLWFVLGADFIYALAFITFLSYGKSELNSQKEALTKKCQRQKEEDAAALAEEEKDYVERISIEYQYFEFINTLRLLSREILTKVNPETGAHKIDTLLQELRDKLFFFNETFCSRFLNEEIRNADFYEDGSALRHLATVKEIFASHIALLWMAIKHTHGSLKGKNLGEDETFKLNFIPKHLILHIKN